MLLDRPRHLRYQRALSHDARRLAGRFVVDPARAEFARASVGAASWCQPFSGLFGDLNALLQHVPRHVANIVAFPGCRRGELAQIRAELAEIKRSMSVR